MVDGRRSTRTLLVVRALCLACLVFVVGPLVLSDAYRDTSAGNVVMVVVVVALVVAFSTMIWRGRRGWSR